MRGKYAQSVHPDRPAGPDIRIRDIIGGGNIGAQDGDDPLRGIDLPPADTPTASIDTAALTLLSPAPDTALTIDQPTLTWTAPPGAAWLRVRVWRPNGQPLFDQRFSADELTTLCVDGLCRLNLAEQGVRLREGRRYTWRVIAMLPGESEPVRSERRGFRVGDVEANNNIELPLIYEETFNPAEPLPHWVMAFDSTYDLYNHAGYLPVTTGQLFELPYGYIDNLDMRVRATFHTGGIRLRVRHSGLGEYTIAFNTSGQITLYRGLTVLGTGSITTSAGSTHELRVVAVGAEITVSVDDNIILSVTDPTPLPYGVLQFGSDFPGETIVHLHSLRLAATSSDAPFLGHDIIGDLLSVQESLNGVAVAPTPTLNLTGNDKIFFEQPNPTPALGSGIYVASLNGDDRAEVMVEGTKPKLSPDGTKLAFLSARDGGRRVWIKYLNDGSLVRVTPPRVTGPSGCGTTGYNDCSDSDFTWSPDSGRIAFVRNGSNIPYVILMINLDTRIVTAIYPSPGANRFAYDLAWRPIHEPQQIAYAVGCAAGFSFSCTNYRSDIRMITLGQTGERVVVSQHNVALNAPVWSHDGRFLAYRASNNTLLVREPVINPPGTTPSPSPTAMQLYSNTGLGHFDWHPDGSYLALIQRDGSYGYIRYVDLNGDLQQAPVTGTPAAVQIGTVVHGGGLSWGRGVDNPRTIDGCISVPVPANIPIHRGTPQPGIPTITGTPLAPPNRLLLSGRLDNSTDRWLKATAYYPASGQTPTPFAGSGGLWVRNTNFGQLDACDDSTTINVRSAGYTDDVFYLPDLTIMTATAAPPTPTLTPVVPCSVTNTGTMGANIRPGPGAATTPLGTIPVGGSALVTGITDAAVPVVGQADAYLWYRVENWSGPGQVGWTAKTGSLTLSGGNCDQLPVYNVQATPNPTPSPTLTRTPTATATRGISPTPTLTPTYIPRETLVATQAVPFHREAVRFGLPAPFDQWPRVDPVLFQNGYGPNFIAHRDCNLATSTENCQYLETRLIHQGIDYYTPDEFNAEIGDLVVAICDGVIIRGRIDGGSAADNPEVNGLSLRCFANDPNDPDKDGNRNLSNIVVVYNHIWDPQATPRPGVTPPPMPPAIRKDSYQIVRKGQPLGHTSRYNTSSGKRPLAHLDLQIFIAQSYTTADAVQINPLMMFQNDMVQKHYTPLVPTPVSMVYPDCCDEWTLQGNGMRAYITVQGQEAAERLSYWKYPANPVFITDLVTSLSSRYTLPVYVGPNCIGLPAYLPSGQLGTAPYELCQIDTDDTNLTPTP